MTKEEIPSIKNEIHKVQELWHTSFQDDYVPNDKLCVALLREFGYEEFLYAIEVCSTNSRINTQSFETRLKYTRGILKNIQKKKWEDEG